MFDEIIVLLDDIRAHVGIVKRNVIYGGQFLYALALATSYNNLIQLADERTQDHPEVQRVPTLRLTLLEHLYLHVFNHINLQKGTIFDDGLLGGPRTLREWQEAGYHTSRSAANYPKRLRYWKSLYDGAPVTFQQQVNTPGNVFSTQRTYQSSFISPKSKIPGRVQRNGADVTYEDVIRSRDTRYAETVQLVPWWRILNYGTGGQGYPVSPALHFVEDAERAVPGNVAVYMGLFEQFVSDTFDNESDDTQLNIEKWAQTHIKLDKEYIPSFDIARRITFGVPF